MEGVHYEAKEFRRRVLGLLSLQRMLIGNVVSGCFIFITSQCTRNTVFITQGHGWTREGIVCWLHNSRHLEHNNLASKEIKLAPMCDRRPGNMYSGRWSIVCDFKFILESRWQSRSLALRPLLLHSVTLAHLNKHPNPPYLLLTFSPISLQNSSFRSSFWGGI